jgi:hypothetical protein
MTDSKPIELRVLELEHLSKLMHREVMNINRTVRVLSIAVFALALSIVAVNLSMRGM